MAWLRSRFARFSSGADHRRRRALAEAPLAGLCTTDLRAAARVRAERRRELPIDRLVRDVPVAVPAAGLGLRIPVADAVTVGAAHLSFADTPAVDAALERLVAAVSGRHDEPTAAVVGLLAQCCEATAALITAALATPGPDTATVVARALRSDPPARATRRTAPDGSIVTVDLTGPESLPFGAGEHACPGDTVAIALAEGVVSALHPGIGSPGTMQYRSVRTDPEPMTTTVEVEQLSRFSEFHDAHHRDTPVLLPNAWDFTSAAALVDAGFDVVGTTSLGVAAAHGLPDATGASRRETLALARRITALPCLVTVDIESGFSDDAMVVAQLVAELEQLGVVGINLEDGRPDGSLIDVHHQAGVIATVKRLVPQVFVNARVDSFWLGQPEPGTIALERARRYLDVGADGIFVPGAVEPADVRHLVHGIPAPVNILYSPAHLSLADLAELGVARVSTGSLLFRAAVGATVATARAVRDGEPLPAGIPSYTDITGLGTAG